jgi:hypothetical protein
MKKILIIISFLSITILLQAQNIRGKVINEKDKIPVQFATVVLLHLPDSSIINGVITLTDGDYLLEKVKSGDYFVKASLVGFKANGKKVSIKEGQAETFVDTIFLSEVTKELNEVTVVAERLKGKEMVDRTVYAVPEVISKSSTNGYDILKKIPQVNVDFQNNISLNGSSNFIIQVDGKQRNREFLARLLPSDIKSIEIISNPSGKYEGNVDGVINIILKKEARYGINGSIVSSLKPFNRVTSSLTGSIDYSAGKTTFYITGLSYLQKLKINPITESRFNTIDSLTSAIGDGDLKVTQSTVNGGMDYYVNDKNNLSINISYQPIGQTIYNPSNTFLIKNADTLNTLSSESKTNMESDEISMSIFYKKTFAKPVEEFTTELTYYLFNSDQGNNFSNVRFPFKSDQVLSTYSRVEDNLNKRNYMSAKLDYVYPIGLSAKIETGYQLYYQHMSYDFEIDEQDASNLFAYSEIRNSAYGGITFNMKKFGIQTLLRVENSHIEADSVKKPDYSCILPTVNLQYKFSQSHNIKLSYNRRINRPGIYDMNPYWKISQNYAVTQGNPDLRPDYRDRLQLTYTWNFGSNYFSPYIYSEFFSDKTGTRISIINSPVNGEYTTISKPYNILSGYEHGAGVNAMLWYLNINTRIFKGHYSGYSEPTFSIAPRNYFSYAITSTAFAPLDKKKKTVAYIYLSYNGVNINAQSKTYSLPLYGFGGQSQIKNHTMGIFWLLPFSKNINYQRTETVTPAFNSTNITGIDISGFLQFSYAYRFNKGRNVKKLNRKVEVESDSKSQTIGK